MPSDPQEILKLSGGDTIVHWTRSARARRVSLRIDAREGRVVVTLPLRAGRSAGMALLARHADWVADRLAALPARIEIADGAVLPIDGAPHRIRHAPNGHATPVRASSGAAGGRGAVRVIAGEIAVSGDPAFLARRVRDHLRAQAQLRFGAQALEIARPAGLAPRRVVVKDTRSRWGSCSADRVLMFSWRLIMAPPFVQHYVVAHEVAHLRHLDHGAAFWALVDELSPWRAAGMAWLAQAGPGLLRVG